MGFGGYLYLLNFQKLLDSCVYLFWRVLAKFLADVMIFVVFQKDCQGCIGTLDVDFCIHQDMNDTSDQDTVEIRTHLFAWIVNRDIHLIEIEDVLP